LWSSRLCNTIEDFVHDEVQTLSFSHRGSAPFFLHGCEARHSNCRLLGLGVLAVVGHTSDPGAQWQRATVVFVQAVTGPISPAVAVLHTRRHNFVLGKNATGRPHVHLCESILQCNITFHNQFYNPALYKSPPKRELTDEDRATLAAGGTLAPTAAPGGIAGTGVTVLSQVREHNVAAPPPPPEAPGAYKKKGEESNGVIAMIDLLIKDLDKEMTVAKTEEKDSQSDYETMMKDSAEKRAEDSKSLAQKTGTLANLESSLQTATDDKASTNNELMATVQYIASLHAECDWLLQYFDVRKEARDSEVDALGKAKAVLSGADFSLVQTRTQKFLQ